MGYEIFQDCDRYNVETLTVRKYVAEYTKIDGRISQQVSAQSRGIKIA